jgi:Skp family chaperone for outer membrane proteins
MVFRIKFINMKKYILLLLIVMALPNSLYSQSRGVKIGYIDMEYILQNVPDYNEAKNQLEQKAQKWKQEIETKKNEISRLKELLATERVLLTKELLEEREEEITFQEKELLDYQEKRFGPKGDLTIQKAVLAQPIQDQVFTAAQDIAEAKKYDFILNKTSDLTLLFAAKRYDISDQVVRVITRTNKRNQLTKKQLKEEEAKEAKEDMVDESPALAERNKKLEERKAAREKLIADRKALVDEKKLALEEKKKQAKAEKEALKNGTPLPVKNDVNNEKSQDSTSINGIKNETSIMPKKEIDSSLVLKKQKAAEERAKVLADRKKAIEDKKKLLQEKKESKKSTGVTAVKDSISSTTETKVPQEKLPKKSADTTAVNKKLKTAEERAKIIEDRKKALEEKKKKALEDREAAKKAKEGK